MLAVLPASEPDRIGSLGATVDPPQGNVKTLAV